MQIIFTISYTLVILGSGGMIVFATHFPLSGRIKDLKDAGNIVKPFCGLNGWQVWAYSWSAILLGTAGQILATWWPIICP